MVVGATPGDVAPAPHPDRALSVNASGLWAHHRHPETVNRWIVVGPADEGDRGVVPLRVMVVRGQVGQRRASALT
jgi:hypothetical protein